MSSAMKRVPSFGRKPKRESSAASAESASCEEGSSRQSDAGAERSTEKPSSAGSRLGRIARSASFGRAKGKRPGSGTETGSSSSQSSPDSSDAASPGLALPPGKIMSAPSTRGLGSLHGFLLKKHTRDKTVSYQWAKRYFLVDDALGTLCYSKGVTRKPSVVLPLINITSVEEVAENHHGYFGFLVSCPPLHLTLCAEDREDRHLWVKGLRRRVKLWQDMVAATGEPDAGSGKRRSAHNGETFPVVSPSPPAPLPVATSRPASAEDAGDSNTAASESELAATDEDNGAPTVAVIKKKKKKTKEQTVGEHAQGDVAAHLHTTTNESGQSKSREAGGSRSGSGSPRLSLHSSRSRTGMAPNGSDAASNAGVEAGPRQAREGTAGEASAHPAGSDDEESEVFPPGASKIQTMEVMSDSDSEDGHSSRHRTAISREASDWARLAPKGNLNELLSSDEEEADEEGIPKDVPMPVRVVPQTKPTPLAIEYPLPEENYAEEEEAAQRSTSPACRSTGSEGQSPARPWGSPQPSRDGATGSPGLQAPAGQDAGVDDQVWDDDSEDGFEGASPNRHGAALGSHISAAAAPALPLSGGPGIIADKNFVEDDWDSDE